MRLYLATYLKHCCECGSIEPPAMNLEQIWQVVEKSVAAGVKL